MLLDYLALIVGQSYHTHRDSLHIDIMQLTSFATVIQVFLFQMTYKLCAPSSVEKELLTVILYNVVARPKCCRFKGETRIQ